MIFKKLELSVAFQKLFCALTRVNLMHMIFSLLRGVRGRNQKIKTRSLQLNEVGGFFYEAGFTVKSLI